MARRILYLLATVVLVAGIINAFAMTPPTCGGDTEPNTCETGARFSAAAGYVTISLLLFYVGRAIGNRRQ